MSIYNWGYFDGEDSEVGYGGYRYEQVYPYIRTMAEILIDICNPTRVLDVGCAKGFLVKAFWDLGVEAVGVDASVYAIRNSATKAVFLNDVEMGLGGLKDSTFDFVTCLDVFEHLRAPENLISEVMRVLKPRGYFFIIITSPRNRSNRKDPTQVSILFEDEWMQMLEAFERLYEDEKRIRRAIANYYSICYSNTTPSSFVGKILSCIKLRNFAIHLHEQLILKRNRYIYLMRKE